MTAPLDARVLPHSLEAERSVLGAVLLQNEFLEHVRAIVQPSDFYRDAHARIFEHVIKLHDRREPVDFLTLRESLAASDELERVGGPAYITALVDGVPRSTNVEHYAAIVREYATRRRLVLVGQKLIAEAHESDDSPADLIDRAHSALFKVAERQSVDTLTDSRALMPELLGVVDQLVADKRLVTGVPTGLTDLDELTRGLQPRDLIVVAARPSMGKTSFGMNVVQHAAIRASRRALVFSLEMGRRPIGLRLLASEGRVDHHKLLSGHLGDADWGRLSNAMGRLEAGAIYVDDAAVVTVFDVRAKARRLQAGGGLDLIVIDYLQLMTGAQKAENKNLEVAAITKGLKAIARDLDVPVLLLSQLSREPDKRGNHRPQLSDLRDSGAIEQDADVVIGLHREEKYAPTADNRGVAEAILLKQRNGPTGTVRLLFHDHLVRFDNLVWSAGRRPCAEDRP